MNSRLYDIAFHPDGSQVFCSATNGIEVWDVGTDRLVGLFPSRFPCYTIVVSPQHPILFGFSSDKSGFEEQTLSFWNIDTKVLVRQSKRTMGGTSALFTVDGGHLFTHSEDDPRMHTEDLRDLLEELHLPFESSMVTPKGLYEDEAVWLSREDDTPSSLEASVSSTLTTGRIQAVDATLVSKQTPPPPVEGICLSSDSQIVGAITRGSPKSGRTITMWDVQTGDRMVVCAGNVFHDGE